MTMALLAPPRSDSPIGAGSPATPSDGSMINVGVLASLPIAGVADVSGPDSVLLPSVGGRQLSKRASRGGMAMTATRAVANMQPTAIAMTGADLLLPGREGGARRTCPPTQQSAASNELGDTLGLPPPC